MAEAYILSVWYRVSVVSLMHATDCSYKSNSEYLKTEFEFKLINWRSNVRSLFNIPSSVS